MIDAYTKGASFREMLDRKAKREGVNQALKSSMVTGPDGKTRLDQDRALSSLAQIDPQSAMNLQNKFEAKEQARQANMLKVKESGYIPVQDDMGKVIGFEINPNQPLSFEKMHKNRMYDLKKLDHEMKQKTDKYKSTDDLRKERSKMKTTLATQDIVPAYNKIQASAMDPSPAGDLSMVFNYMKLLDPGSVVRESEFKTAAAAKAWIGKMDGKGEGSRVPNTIRSFLQKAGEGTILLPEQRADFLKQAENVYGAQMKTQQNVDATFTQLAQDRGLDPSKVLVKYESDGSYKKKREAKLNKSTKKNKDFVNDVIKGSQIEWAEDN